MKPLRLLIAALTGAACVLPWAAQAADYRGCAVVNVDKVLREAKATRATQARLSAELGPRAAQSQRLADAMAQTEKAWVASVQAQPGAAEIAARRNAYDQAIVAYTNDKRQFDALLERRKNEELRKLLERTNALYRKLGEREKYARLYATNQSAPVFPPTEDALEFPCAAPVDVTAELIKALDAAP